MVKQDIKELVIGIAGAILLVFFTTAPVLAAEAPKVVKAGVVIPLTGPLTSIGIACQRGAVMAVDHINKDGGIKSLGGAKIKLFFGDNEAKPAVAMAEGERLIKQEKVDVLIGCFTSSCTFPLTQVAERSKVPMLVPCSAKDEITERGFKYTFRLVGKAGNIAGEQINFLRWLVTETNVPIKTLGLLFEDSAWGQSIARGVRKLAPKAGYKIVADLSYSKDTKDVRSTILKLKAANPDAVIQESYTVDAILITKTMNELQFDCKGILATGSGHGSPDYHIAVGGLDEYMMQWEAWSGSIPLDEVKERVKEFQERFKKRIDPFAALFYTSVYTLAYALEDAGRLDKDKIRDALTRVNIGVGGKGNLFLFPATYDENGQGPASGLITQRLNGKMEVLYPETGATARPVFPVPPWKERK